MLLSGELDKGLMKTLLIIITLDTVPTSGVGVVHVESSIFNAQQRTGSIDCQIKSVSCKKCFAFCFAYHLKAQARDRVCWSHRSKSWKLWGESTLFSSWYRSSEDSPNSRPPDQGRGLCWTWKVSGPRRRNDWILQENFTPTETSVLVFMKRDCSGPRSATSDVIQVLIIRKEVSSWLAK